MSEEQIKNLINHNQLTSRGTTIVAYTCIKKEVISHQNNQYYIWLFSIYVLAKKNFETQFVTQHGQKVKGLEQHLNIYIFINWTIRQ